MAGRVVGADVEVVEDDVVVASVVDVVGPVVAGDEVVEPTVVEVVGSDVVDVKGVVDVVVLFVVDVLVLRVEAVVVVVLVDFVVVGFDDVGVCVIVVASATVVVPAPAPGAVVVVDCLGGTVVVGFEYEESTGASPRSSGVEPFSQAMPSLSLSRLSR